MTDTPETIRLEKRLRIVYTSLPAFGHVDWGGALETLGELASRGHEVYLASGSILKRVPDAHALGFLDLGLSPIRCLGSGEQISELLDVHRRENFFNAHETFTAIEALRRFHSAAHIDVIVSDPFCKAGVIFSNLTGTKYVSIAPHPKPLNRTLSEKIQADFQDYQHRLCQRIGDITALFDPLYPLVSFSPKLNIYFSTPQFDGLEASRARQFVGATSAASSPSKRTSIYFSSGTLFWSPQQDDLVLSCARKSPDILFYTSITQDRLKNQNIPRNVVPTLFDDEPSVLKKVHLLITQGGMGTVIKGIRYGVPMVVVPLFYGNYPIAKRVHAAGSGIALLTEQEQRHQLEHAVAQILEDATFQRRANALGECFNARGGFARAADLIEAYGCNRDA